MSRAVLMISLLALCTNTAAADEARAMQRLMNAVQGLQGIGDVMEVEPVTGNAVLGDTVSMDLILSSSFMYHVHIFSDSYFNVLDFWLSDPGGNSVGVAAGDHASLAVYPDTSGAWTLNILLCSGADSDSASWAAAMFKGERYLH